jgi:hypothetical protein
MCPLALQVTDMLAGPDKFIRLVGTKSANVPKIYSLPYSFQKRYNHLKINEKLVLDI